VGFTFFTVIKIKQILWSLTFSHHKILGCFTASDCKLQVTIILNKMMRDWISLTFLLPKDDESWFLGILKLQLKCDPAFH
jgi:hypothetical protein